MSADKTYERLVQRTTGRRARRRNQRQCNESLSTTPLCQSNEGNETPFKAKDMKSKQQRMPCLDKINMIDASIVRRSRLYSHASNEASDLHDDSAKSEVEGRIKIHSNDLYSYASNDSSTSDIKDTSTKCELKGRIEVDSSSRVIGRSKRGHEYKNHTADIQIHAWGASLSEALSEVVQSMIGYMVKLDNVEIDKKESKRVSAQGHDVNSMVYNFLNEWLFIFLDSGFIEWLFIFLDSGFIRLRREVIHVET